jgi:hypothetical protein
MHFILAWSVNVAAATNFHGSGTPQEATTTYSHCYSFVCNDDDTLLSGIQRQIGTAEIREKLSSGAREILRKPANICQPRVQ